MVFPSHPSSIATSLSAVRDDEQQAQMQLCLSSLRLLHQERTRHRRHAAKCNRRVDMIHSFLIRECNDPRGAYRIQQDLNFTRASKGAKR